MSRPTRVPTGRFAPPAPVRELTAVSATGARIHVETHGPQDGPPVVLAHGWTCSTVFWAPVIRRLTAEGHRVVAYDQRGHGRSPATPGRYGVQGLADDLCAVLDTVLDEDERAVIGGHSMGGMTVMAAAGRPALRRHAAAVLLCSTGAQRLSGQARVIPLRSERTRAAAHKLLLGSPLPLGPVSALSRRALAYATMGPGAPADAVEACARIVHACPRLVRSAWGGVLHALDVVRQLPELTVPTAVLAGTRDRLTPVAHARELAAALPDCVALHELPGLGHMTPMEDPETVADVLRALARDHLPGGAGDAGSGARGTKTTEFEETA
ncbi:alpha/beta hydrolase [Streptomyces sp. TRM 70351]|uniref:alpha/beta fold hydrolase n=1 Tax=Streptomyces sp. TRM 70351 TaxID=3116552 RepID=UPI002E7AED85|nr:alpha/beta hydrolase [Streptomyces sp. TRM 70351]MEE1929479.1 alpha/beta hydrolase [Streptomyces sp. TRM 70351]